MSLLDNIFQKVNKEDNVEGSKVVDLNHCFLFEISNIFERI